MSAAEAREYCARLARSHYENFHVASFLLPRALHQDFYNVYAYCRWSDDLGDETGDPRRSTELLERWREELKACYSGRPPAGASHPVFVALAETIRRHEIPPEPFLDLLHAFLQDQKVGTYSTYAALLDYCRYSANPVGRLVLCLAQCHEPRRAIRADSICTGLQLVNFLQDVALDWDRGRIYLPRTHLLHYGYDEPMFAGRQANEAFRRLMAALAAEAEGFLRRGLPLVKMMPPEFELDVALFIHGGLAILDKIRQVDYDVWTRRPVLTGFEKLRLVIRCWWQLRHPPEPEPEEEPEES